MATSRRKTATVEREFDPTRWAHVCFFGFFLMGAWVFIHLTDDIWNFTWTLWPQVGRPQQTPTTIIGVAIALAGYLYALRRDDWTQFVREVAVEVSQIIWPTRSETRAATVVVITLTLICSGILAIMDVIWKAVTDGIYGI